MLPSAVKDCLIGKHLSAVHIEGLCQLFEAFARDWHGNLVVFDDLVDSLVE